MDKQKTDDIGRTADTILFENENDPDEGKPDERQDVAKINGANKDTNRSFVKRKHVEWSGQTMASLFWIVSVFVYGIEGTGDILQLCAALSWFVANMAALLPLPE